MPTKNENLPCNLLVSFGAIDKPTKSQLDILVELRGMTHEVLGQMAHSQLKKYLGEHASEEQIATASRIRKDVGAGLNR